VINASAAISSQPPSCSCRPSAPATTPPILQLAPAMLTHLIGLVPLWRRFTGVLARLERMSDSELAAHGISRSDVARLAMKHSDR
jgi:uncharacterized protein YjiS (DUF1127 family)